MFAFIGFLLSLAAHLSTFRSVNLIEQFPFVWALHVGIFIVFIPFILQAKKLYGKQNNGRQFFKDYMSALPLYAKIVVYTVGAYAVFNFVTGIISSEKTGNVTEVNGKYMIAKEKREVSKKEFEESQRLTLRMFSGHWMMFYLIPAFYFLTPKRRRLI